MGRRGRGRIGKGKPRRKRTARDWEQPGAIIKGPPITLTCECGEKRELAYGERWRCEQCGRSWDTSRIPTEQYEEIRRLSLRFRAVPIAFGALIALLAIVFTLTGNWPGVFFLMPVALVSWFVFIRPFHRKRYRAAVSSLPRWELRAE